MGTVVIAGKRACVYVCVRVLSFIKRQRGYAEFHWTPFLRRMSCQRAVDDE